MIKFLINYIKTYIKCKKLGLGVFVIKRNLEVDVYTDVEINCFLYNGLIPVKFGTVYADFRIFHYSFGNSNYGKYGWNAAKLKSLQNSPQVIYGNFDISGLLLRDLKYCPSIIHGNFNVSMNLLSKLDDGPKIVNGDYDASTNMIDTLKGLDVNISGYFDLISNNIYNIDDLLHVSNTMAHRASLLDNRIHYIKTRYIRGNDVRVDLMKDFRAIVGNTIYRDNLISFLDYIDFVYYIEDELSSLRLEGYEII